MAESIHTADTIVVTGALSYTGRYATQLLLGRGYKVRTLTNHPERANPFGDQVQVLSYNFDHPDRLAQDLHGASTLINTYWVRFPRGKSSFDTAVQNTKTLIAAARTAGVKRIVHVSIANPSLQSLLAYYKGKALLEQAVVESGLDYAILRPTVIFGLEDILINNLTWFVRHFPLFGIPGDGRYRIRPIYVGDMAQLMADAVEQKASTVLDAVGPETFTFEQLVRLIGAKIDRPIRMLHLPVPLAYAFTRLTGWLVRDVVLTQEEYMGLMGDLLVSDGPSSGKTRLSQWLAENRENVGRHYVSEVERHYAMPSLRKGLPTV